METIRTEVRAVAAEVADRLRRRGIAMDEQERPEDVGDLLAAVERFEAAVKAHGGDLMVDDLNSSQPDDPHFVLPQRAPSQSIRDYIAAIDDATVALRDHPTVE